MIKFILFMKYALSLVATPIEEIIEKSEALLASHGQTIQKAAELAFANGNILETDLYAILAERK